MKKKGTFMPLVIERFDSQTVAEKVSALFGLVPESGGKHPVEPLQRVLNSPVFKGRQHDFRIRRAPKAVSQICQLLAEPKKVIDLAVKGDDITVALGVHRLVAGGAKVIYREAAMSEAYTSIRGNPNSFRIRAAVVLSVVQRLKEILWARFG